MTSEYIKVKEYMNNIPDWEYRGLLCWQYKDTEYFIVLRLNKNITLITGTDLKIIGLWECFEDFLVVADKVLSNPYKYAVIKEYRSVMESIDNLE